MQYGICPLSIVPLRFEPTDKSELVNQVLYGEIFKVLEQRKKWSRIRLEHDKYEGWIDNKQYKELHENEYAFAKAQPKKLSPDPVQLITNQNAGILSVVMGSYLQNCDMLKHTYDIATIGGKKTKSHIVETAVLFLNTPYLWGGRTHFGIDCSGFTQMAYRLNGHRISRDASQQAMQGEALSFIEESEPGDLAFFDNAEGTIVHVGIIMGDNYIIHARGSTHRSSRSFWYL